MNTREDILKQIREIVEQRKTVSEEIKTIHRTEIMGRRETRRALSVELKNLVKSLKGLKKAEKKAVVKAPKAKKAPKTQDAPVPEAVVNQTPEGPVTPETQPVICGPGALNQ